MEDETNSDNISESGSAEFLVVSDDERLWAMLAHLSGALGNLAGIAQWIGPLVVYFVYKDKSKYVAFHALQSLYFQLGVMVTVVLAALLTCVFFGVGAIAVAVGALVYAIIGALQAYDGRMFEYWLAGKWARDQIEI